MDHDRERQVILERAAANFEGKKRITANRSKIEIERVRELRQRFSLDQPELLAVALRISTARARWLLNASEQEL